MTDIKPEILDEKEDVSGHMTVSTTADLIVKSPQDSPNCSVKKESMRDVEVDTECAGGGAVLYLAVMQILFGMLMSVFGVLVILHDASLSQIGGGLWGGCLAVGAGTAGILSEARKWCPLRRGAHKVAQTIFLALSLVSLALAQLVLVLAATGLARDIQKTEIIEINSQENNPALDDIVEVLPSNYPALLGNAGLVLVCAIQCVCAAVASYKAARAICPCFKSGEDNARLNHRYGNGREALVSSWLGNHTPPPHIYLVHAPPSSIGKHSKMSGGLPVTPIFALPQQVMAPNVYPLIPAPLGPVPSPIIPPQTRERNYRRNLRERVIPAHHIQKTKPGKGDQQRSKSKERPITTEDVAKTYTGLDRTIAEEFIQICDSRNNSLCSSDSSCPSSSCQCGSQSGCAGCNSELGSRDYLIDKI